MGSLPLGAAEDVALTGDVLSVNRGGLLVEVEKLRGFVPQSHIGVRTLNREELIGQQMPFKFIEVDEEKNRLVLSHRLATDMVSAEGLEVGDVVEGLVQAVKPYGAFVDVGGQSGLLHISQICAEASSLSKTCFLRAIASRFWSCLRMPSAADCRSARRSSSRTTATCFATRRLSLRLRRRWVVNSAKRCKLPRASP